MGTRLCPAQGIELIKAFNIWEEDAAIRIPILPNYADIPRIAELVPDALDPAVPGILPRNHGIYAWGKMHSKPRNIWRLLSLYSNTPTVVCF